eukprot:Skav218309  [mRNA]  locus=scaffold2388:231572:232718:+ [translate_table: standard]
MRRVHELPGRHANLSCRAMPAIGSMLEMLQPSDRRREWQTALEVLGEGRWLRRRNMSAAANAFKQGDR